MCGSSPSTPSYKPPPIPEPVDPMVNPEDAAAGVRTDIATSSPSDNQRRNLRIDLGTASGGTGLSIPA